MAMTGGTARLVHTGKANYGKDGDINLYVYYKSTQDTANNKSTVYCGMYVTTPSTSYDIGSWTDSKGSYVGTTSNTFNGTIPNFAGTRWLVENKSFTVNHDNEGKATVTIYWKWGVNSPWGGYENPSGSFNITLPQIARASTITSVANANLGSTTKVVFTPKSASFYYKVKLSIGTAESVTGPVRPNTTNAYTLTTNTIPYAFGNQIASTSTSGTVTATLYTYSDSACTKQIGSESTKTFTATIPDNASTKPTVSMTLSPVNTAGKAWSSLYVQGLSRVKATFSGGGKYGATISSYKMNVNGRDYGSPYTSQVLSTDGSYTVTGYASDSRGRTVNEAKSITIIPYGKPRILPNSGESEVVCSRCDGNGTLNDSGTHLRIKAMRSYSKIMSGSTQCNFCNFSYRWKSSGGNYSSWKSILDRENTETDRVDVILDEIYFEPTASYSVQLRLLDDVGKDHIETFIVPTIDVDFNLKEGGGGAAFGKYAERSKAVELADDWDLVMKGETVADFIIQQGTSEGWNYRKWVSGVVEFWGTFESIAVTKAVGIPINDIFYAGYASMLCPTMLQNVDVVNYSIHWTNGYDWCGKSVVSNGKINFYLVSITDAPDTVRINAHVIGRWK